MRSVPATAPRDQVADDRLAARIRPAGPADAAALAVLLAHEARLQEELGGYRLTPGFDWTAWLGARLGGPGQFVYLAEHAHRPIGVIQARLRAPPQPPAPPPARPRPLDPRALLRRLRQWSSRSAPAGPARFDGWGLIESLFVTPPARRQGVARRLVAMVQEEFARRGIERIELSVMVNNAPALALWTDLGFAPFREHRVLSLAPVIAPARHQPSEPTLQPTDRGRT